MNLWYIRQSYLDKIYTYLDQTTLIKVLIWQRRVGKSTIMKQIIHFLQETNHIDVSQIVYINLEIDYLKYNTLESFDETIQQHIQHNIHKKRIYLFVDEVQELLWWEKLLNSYRADDTIDIDIFVTGSNANLLSSDLSTYLAGRYIDFEIMPFSYLEYIWYFKKQQTKQSLIEYMNFTGIPELYNLSTVESQTNFIKSIKDSIILKDIVKRYAIKDIDFLEKILLFLAWNVANLFSLNSIVRVLKNMHIQSNTTTLWNYIHYLERTFIIHGVSRYDLKWKKILEWEKKYYLNDLAFNNFFISSYDIWGGKKLENLVYNYLKQQGYTIFVWTLWALEIDFVAEKWSERLYIQVAYLISTDEVFEREFWNLMKIADNYPKIVLSLDDVLLHYKWIQHYHIWDFLSSCHPL